MAARASRGNPRGQGGSNSPMASAVGLFDEGWDGGEIPGIFNDEEELERDIAKLKSIADDIWGQFVPPQILMDGVEPTPLSSRTTSAVNLGTGSELPRADNVGGVVITQGVASRGGTPAGEPEAPENPDRSTTPQGGRGPTPPAQAASFASIGTQELDGIEMENFNSESPDNVVRPVPVHPSGGTPAMSLDVSSAEDRIVNQTEARDAVRVSRIDESELAKPVPYCFGYFRDEAECKMKTIALFEDPNFSPAAWYISATVFIFIIISTITIVIETLPDFENDDSKLHFFIVECMAIFVFTVEYTVRWWAHDKVWEFMCEPLNVIDLVAIIPFYVDLLLLALSIENDFFSNFMKLFRLIRVLRIFKLARYNENIVLCMTAMVESQDTLGLMVFMLSIVVVVFSSFVFFFEHGTEQSNGEWLVENAICTASIQDTQNNPNVCKSRTKFVSIPGSMWWTLVTMMTVGYGDMYPLTIPGKLVATVTMLSSIVILALPISVIGANFSRAWMDRKELNERYMDGHEVSIVYRNLIHNLAEHNGILEDMLSAESSKIADLGEDLKEACLEYQCLADTMGPSAVDPAREEGLPVAVELNDKLKALLRSIDEQERSIRESLEITKMVQNSDFDQSIIEAIGRCDNMEIVVAEQCMLSAKIEMREKQIMGRLLSVPLGP